LNKSTKSIIYRKYHEKKASIVIVSTLFAVSSASFAASHAAAPTSAVSATSLPMAEAEIRKIDLENKKVTLKHGEIKNLDMPGMTMVFQVKDGVMLDNIKTGDKVKFTADKINGAYTVLSLEILK
jgi:Cu(I)/Ag(I) efflux system periplasmic protein CusF